MKRLVVTSFLMVLCITAIFSQVQEGRGTWYETDSKGLTASHANLPFGTRVRVTNLQNDRQVIVTINNRIVETPNRLIDISKAAATNMEMNERGTTPVRIEVISRRATPAAAAPATTPPANTDTAPPREEELYTESVAAAPPASAYPEEELSVTTTAVSRRPAVQPEPKPDPQKSANPGIVNQTVITINGMPAAGTPDAGSGAASAGLNPPYVSSPEGTAAIADSRPSVVSVPPVVAAPAPAVVSPNPAVVAPNPAVVSPSPVVVAPAPAVISPVIVPPVIAQPVLVPPVLAPPVLAPPILAEPVLANPILSEPIVSTPVVSEPVVSTPVISEPVVSNPVRSEPLRAPPVVTASPPAARPPSVPRPQGEVVPARIVPRKPDPYSQTLYRVQVGSFLDERNAMAAYKRLVDAGFSPSYEHYNNYFRVVLTRIRAGEIENVAWRLGAAHFSEILLREER